MLYLSATALGTVSEFVKSSKTWRVYEILNLDTAASDFNEWML